MPFLCFYTFFYKDFHEYLQAWKGFLQVNYHKLILIEKFY